MNPRVRCALGRAALALLAVPALLAYGAGMPSLPPRAVLDGVGLLAFAAGPSGAFAWVALVALVTCVAVFGAAPVARAAAFAVRGADAGRGAPTPPPRPELEPVADVLALAARVVLGLGLAFCVAEFSAGLAAIDAALRGVPAQGAPRLARGVTAALGMPLATVLVGHLWLGASAAAARRAAARTGGATPLGPFAGLAVLLYLLPLFQMLLFMFARYR